MTRSPPITAHLAAGLNEEAVLQLSSEHELVYSERQAGLAPGLVRLAVGVLEVDRRSKSASELLPQVQRQSIRRGQVVISDVIHQEGVVLKQVCIEVVDDIIILIVVILRICSN